MPDNSLKWFYPTIVMLALVLLFVFTLTAYNKNVPQLGIFGAVYIGMLIVGLLVWWAWSNDEEPYMGKFVATGGIIILLLLVASALTGMISKEWSFMSVLTPGQGMLSTVPTNTQTTLLAYELNIPGPVAEEAFFRVALCTALLLAFGKGNINNVSIPQKVMVVITSCGVFGWMHYYSYGANLSQIAAAITAGAVLSFYYVFIQRSALIVTAGHFVYNFIVLSLTTFGTAAFALAPTLAPFLSVIPLVLLLHTFRVYSNRFNFMLRRTLKNGKI